MPETAAPSDLPVIATDLPVMYEDEGQEEMGDSLPHTTTEAILRFGLMAHLADRPEHAVLSNMNLYYHPVVRWAYVSPDVMVVTPPAPLPRELTSYRLGAQGPAPVFTAEVLSRRTFQQGDLTLKPVIYADMGVPEYLLVDVTAQFLPQRLMLKTLRPDGTWINDPDQGDGVVSQLGVRFVINGDDELRVIDAATGHRYPRPDEADDLARALQAEAEARQAAETRVRGLEAELARLRGTPPNGT